ncbi:MAG: AmmeMemoRadiSam system protein A [Methylococcales bacterium]
MLLNKKNKLILLDLAYQSIQMGLRTGHPLSIDLRDYPNEFSQQRATFVTLEKNKQLRGCIGMLEAVFPLAEDVCENAFSAAFRDPRFPPVEQAELDELDIHISILSPSEEILFTSEQDLIAKIRPNIDGLILQCGPRKGTFLPSVWQSIPTSKQFLQHLKQKAGLAKNYWSDQVKVYRYTTETVAKERA